MISKAVIAQAAGSLPVCLAFLSGIYPWHTYQRSFRDFLPGSTGLFFKHATRSGSPDTSCIFLPPPMRYHTLISAMQLLIFQQAPCRSSWKTQSTPNTPTSSNLRIAEVPPPLLRFAVFWSTRAASLLLQEYVSSATSFSILMCPYLDQR